MTLKAWTLDTGPQGTAITAGNTGSTLVSIGAGNSAIFDAAMKSQGNFGVKFSYVAGATNSLFRTTANAANNTLALSGVLTTPPTQPGSLSNAPTVLSVWNTAGIAVFTMLFNQSRNLVARDRVATSTVVASALTLATQYRVEAQLTAGTGTNDTFKVQLYKVSDGSQVASITVSNANLATSTLTYVDWGLVGTISESNSHGWDVPQLDDGRATAIGPYVAPVGPTAALNTAPAGLQVSLDGSGSTAAGSAQIVSYRWDFGNGNTSTTSTPTTTATYASAGTYTVTLTVTDSNALTATATQTVTIYAPAASVGPQGVVSAVGYSVVGSAPDLITGIQDADSTTGVKSPPGGGPIIVQLQPHLVPNPGSNWVITWEGDMTGASVGTVPLKVYQGTSGTPLFTVAGQALVNVATDSAYTHTLTWTIPSSTWSGVVTNWNAIRVEADPAVS